jgi:glycosyltransferase involved in cell wall biosynthesis
VAKLIETHMQTSSGKDVLSQITFTVFTATYNRAHTLHRVYESLKEQTYRQFEWLIVDDGSTDTTRTLVETWQQEANFLISYYYQENQGKHVAINRGVQEARGEYFLIIDSDDTCVPQTLERFAHLRII